jgi:hypothetical protein
MAAVMIGVDPHKSLLENRPAQGGDVSGCSRAERGVSLK